MQDSLVTSCPEGVAEGVGAGLGVVAEVLPAAVVAGAGVEAGAGDGVGAGADSAVYLCCTTHILSSNIVDCMRGMVKCGCH